MNAAKIQTYFFAGTALFIAAAIVAFPKTSVDASLNGLNMWWNVVFPSLLPFFIVAELLIGFGIVAFIGVLLEPFMRPIFRVPGVGGFVFVMGLVSGFPAGAKITARLYQEKQLTKTEAERLASFTNFSNPLFIFGAVAYGFFEFEKATLGIILAASHYFGNIAVGMMMRFYRGEEVRGHQPFDEKRYPTLIRAIFRMHEERMKHQKPFGKLLGDAVQSSVSTLLMVGGFIIFFSVLNNLLDKVNITDFFAFITRHFFVLFKLDPALSQGLIPGLFEITVGVQKVSGIDAPLMEAIIVSSFILGFGGFSIQAQVASILAEVNLNSKPFFIGRIFHGFVSAITAGVLFSYLKEDILKQTAPVINRNGALWFSDAWSHWLTWGSAFTLFALLTAVLVTANRLLSKRL